MKNLLYYPYINLAENDWFTKAILYSDEVNIIIPDSFAWNPNSIRPFTRELVKSEIVKQAIPYNYNINFEALENTLLKIVQSEEFEIDNKRANLSLGNFDKIHDDKFANEIFLKLYDLGLAHGTGSKWHAVETTTSRILMWLLATAISTLNNWNPSTDENFYFSNRFYKNFKGYKKEQLRQTILNEVLPIPKNPDYKKLHRFKISNIEKLGLFRDELEKTIQLISKIEDNEERVSQAQILKDNLKEQVEELTAKLNESKLGEVVKSIFGTAVITGGSMWYFDTITPIVGGTISGTLAGIKTYRTNPIEGESLEYVALLNRMNDDS